MKVTSNCVVSFETVDCHSVSLLVMLIVARLMEEVSVLYCLQSYAEKLDWLQLTAWELGKQDTHAHKLYCGQAWSVATKVWYGAKQLSYPHLHSCFACLEPDSCWNGSWSHDFRFSYRWITLPSMTSLGDVTGHSRFRTQYYLAQ